MGCVGVAAVGTAITLGVIYWDDIGRNKVLSDLAKDVRKILRTDDMAIALEREPQPLTEENLNYTPYSDNDSSVSGDGEMTFGRKYGRFLVNDGTNDSN